MVAPKPSASKLSPDHKVSPSPKEVTPWALDPSAPTTPPAQAASLSPFNWLNRHKIP